MKNLFKTKKARMHNFTLNEEVSSTVQRCSCVTTITNQEPKTEEVIAFVFEGEDVGRNGTLALSMSLSEAKELSKKIRHLID